MLKKSRFYLICVISSLISVISVSAQEQITITTYYPSPVGVYNDLQANRMAVGDTDGDGQLTAADLPASNNDFLVAGNVGIGTPAPTERLDINGRIRVRLGGPNTITGILGDIAEYVNVSEELKLEWGDVVVIDHKNPGQFTLSSKSYDPLVGGIISDKNQAAMIIGNEEENRQLLALAGQVKCKVTAINGAIAIGDLLTTSPKPGYAMRADIDKLKPGMVLGKALEPVEEGEGRIIVLVALQ